MRFQMRNEPEEGASAKMEISTKKEKDVMYVQVKEDIDLYNAPFFKQTVQDYIKQGERKFLINLSDVS
ncbi:MAG: anti-sigma factor antagonist, partial [Candidatus Hydrogenedentota bacterium]